MIKEYETPKNIGEYLFQLRKKSGFTTKEVQEKTGVSQVTINKYENSKQEPNVRYLLKLLEFYEADILLALSFFK